ncbi:MAG TPA: DUF1707 and DUF4190 domain-containing protein [Solirubrobacteraceae bacterium]|nr:DUF1707 and DUF4190 domain-containing protein [Solirubrobacteraceae bacterium]
MTYDTAPRNLRAADADREAAVERLRIAAGEGRLTPVELEERLATAYAARYCHELAVLTEDVTPPRAPAPAPPRPTFVRPHRSPNGLAIASLLFGVMWMSWFGSVLAILFGHLALRQIDRSGGRQSGRGLAVAGLVLGYFAMLWFAIGVLLFITP